MYSAVVAWWSIFGGVLFSPFSHSKQLRKGHPQNCPKSLINALGVYCNALSNSGWEQGCSTPVPGLPYVLRLQSHLLKNISCDYILIRLSLLLAKLQLRIPMDSKVAGLQISHIKGMKPRVLSDQGLTFKDCSPLSSDSEMRDLVATASESWANFRNLHNHLSCDRIPIQFEHTACQEIIVLCNISVYGKWLYAYIYMWKIQCCCDWCTSHQLDRPSSGIQIYRSIYGCQKKALDWDSDMPQKTLISLLGELLPELLHVAFDFIPVHFPAHTAGRWLGRSLWPAYQCKGKQRGVDPGSIQRNPQIGIYKPQRRNLEVTWYDTKWHEMTRNDTKWHEMTRHDTKWQDMFGYFLLKFGFVCQSCDFWEPVSLRVIPCQGNDRMHFLRVIPCHGVVSSLRTFLPEFSSLL